MASDPRGDVRVTRTGSRSLVLPALLCLAVLGWLVARKTRSEEPSRVPPPRPDTPVDHAPVTTAPAPDPELAARVHQRRDERRDDRRAAAAPKYTENAPGEQRGMAVFPPPGTKPVKRGIVVPEDFELPEGYIRHYQTTDDGRRLPAILMFHPDFAPVDANGQPIALPADRIVPPEMAPPGLAPHVLDPDADVDETVHRRDHSDGTPRIENR